MMEMMQCRTSESVQLRSICSSHQHVKAECTESEISSLNPDSKITNIETVKHENTDFDSVKQEPHNPEPIKVEQSDFVTINPLKRNTPKKKKKKKKRRRKKREAELLVLQHTDNDIAPLEEHADPPIKQKLQRLPRRCKKRQVSDLNGHEKSSNEKSDKANDPNWTPHTTTSVSKRKTCLPIKRPRGRPRKNPSLTLPVPKQKKLKSKKSPVPSRDPPKPGLKRATQLEKKKKAVSKSMDKTPATCYKKPRKQLCERCGKVFLTTRDLKRHEHTHTGAKPFTCSVCQKTFNDYGNMRKHMIVHTDKQPYVCSVCGRGFSWSGNLTRHKFFVHEIRTDAQLQRPLWHQCPICHQNLKCKKSVKHHISSSKCKNKQTVKDKLKEKNHKVKEGQQVSQDA